VFTTLHWSVSKTHAKKNTKNDLTTKHFSNFSRTTQRYILEERTFHAAFVTIFFRLRGVGAVWAMSWFLLWPAAT
jgi:hypothetical protein